jgi:hypothetical protein
MDGWFLRNYRRIWRSFSMSLLRVFVVGVGGVDSFQRIKIIIISLCRAMFSQTLIIGAAIFVISITASIYPSFRELPR